MKFLILLVALCVPFFATAQENEKVVLTSANTVVLRGRIDFRSTQAAQLQLIKVAMQRGLRTYPLYLVLDSPGGSIDAGLGFIEFAKTIKNLHTISIFSASMASSIVEALPGKRYVTNNGLLMFHRASGGFQGQFENGEVESQLIAAKQMVRGMEGISAARMKVSLETYKAMVVNELWLGADNAVLYRAADSKVDIYCSADLINSKLAQVVVTPFGAFELSFSVCPLLRMPLAGSDNSQNSSKYKPPTFQNYKQLLNVKE